MSLPPPARAFPWRGLALAAAVVAVLAVYPPFHFVRRGAAPAAPGKAGAPAAPAVFDAKAFAGEFWRDRLLPAATGAAELAPILRAIATDPVAAAKQHGHKVGEGTTWYYFVRGSGRVVGVERSRLIVEVEGAPGAVVALRTGPVFGNAVRDGTGLLNLNSVPGLTEFNEVSAELNRRVEQDVRPALKAVTTPGVLVRFVGCAEAPETVGSGPLLLILPVQTEVMR